MGAVCSGRSEGSGGTGGRVPRLPGRVGIGPGFSGVLRLPKDRYGSTVRGSPLHKGFPLPPRKFFITQWLICRDVGSDQADDLKSSKSQIDNQPFSFESGKREMAASHRLRPMLLAMTVYMRLGKEFSGITCWVSPLRGSAKPALEIRFLSARLVSKCGPGWATREGRQVRSGSPAGFIPAGLTGSAGQEPGGAKQIAGRVA